MKYALKLPTNWQAVKMETDLSAKRKKSKRSLVELQTYTHTGAFLWKFEHRLGGCGGAAALPRAP